MASAEKEAMKRLRSLSECCICLTTYTDPRMLPCLHTSCLKCFEDIQRKNEKKPGDILPCPLCRNEFPIPADGMKGLQRNFFIESLMEVTDAFNLENKSRPCEMCSLDEDVKDIKEATMRCLNCSEFYCLRCSKIHKRLKVSKDHKIVELSIEVNEEEIRNIAPIRKCVRHLDKALDYYCFDCKRVVCVSCFVEEHQTHKCKDVTTVDKEFRQRIEQSLTEVYDHKEDILSRKSDVKRRKSDFLAKALETENAIRKKNQQLKALIDQHTEELLNELSLLKQRQEKQMDEEIEEIERKLVVQESFVTYCIELKSKGSPSEVCGSVDSLIARANEIRKETVEYLRAPSKPFDFEFIATYHSALQNAGNTIGKLSESKKEFKRCAVVIANCEAAIRMSLNRPDDVTAIEPLPVKFQAIVKASLYTCGGYDAAGENLSVVQVYDTKLNTCTLLTKQMPRAGAWLRGELWENSVILLGNDGFLIYNFVTQTWTVRDKFKLQSSYFDVISNDGKLFVIGCGANSDDVRWIPIANIFYEKLIEWKHYVKLPSNCFKNAFVLGKLEYRV